MYHHHTQLIVARDSEPPEVDLTGEREDIPIIEFASIFASRVTISVGLHDNPEKWLRDTAKRLNALADRVAARAQKDVA